MATRRWDVFEDLTRIIAPSAGAVELMRCIEQQNQIDQLARLVHQVVGSIGRGRTSITSSASPQRARPAVNDLESIASFVRVGEGTARVTVRTAPAVGTPRCRIRAC